MSGKPVPLFVRLRQTMQRLHLWATLFVGLFVLMVTTTGVIALFEKEINRKAHPHLFTITSGPAVGMDKARAAAEARYPDWHLESTVAKPGRPYLIYGHPARQDDERYNIYVDPGTGTVNGLYQPKKTFMGFMTHLHYTLLADGVKFNYPKGTPEWITKWIGEKLSDLVMKITALAFMVMVLTGVVLWWPRAGQWKKALTIRKTPKQYLRDLDWHKVVGVASLPFLFMWALTGLNFYEPFQPAIQKAWYALTFAGSPPPDRKSIKSSVQAGAPRLSAEAARRVAERTIPEAVFISYTPPEKKDDPISVWMSLGFDTYREADWPGNVELLLDAYSGKVLQDGRRLRKSWGATVYNSWFFTTHAASYVPWYLKLPIWAVFGLTPLFLAFTGLRMWWYKRQARKKAAAKNIQTNSARGAALQGDL